MSINGTSYTFEALTLSGLGVSTDLSATYIPYNNANSNANLNNKDLSNVKNITASNVIVGSNATVGTSYPLYAYNVFSYSPTVASILLNGAIQNPFQPGDTFRITGASISAVNTTYIVIANYPAGGFFTVLNNAGLSGNNYPTGGIVYLNDTGTVSSIAVSTNILTASSSTISVETVGLLTATGVSQFGNVKITPFTSSSGTILQYGVGGSTGTFSDRLLINNRSGNNVLYFNDSGDVIQYTGRFQTPTLLLAGITSSFVYTDATGICIGVQAIFSVGQTAGCSPNILLAGGGAFSVSNTTNTQTYLAVLSSGITATIDTSVPKLILAGSYGNNYIKQGNQDNYTPYSLNNNLLIGSWWGIAFPTNDGTVRITMNTRSGDMDIAGLIKAGTFILNGNSSIYTAGCIYTDVNYGMLFRSYQTGNIASFIFRNSSGVSLMAINNNGNTGIGVESPFNNCNQTGKGLDIQGSTAYDGTTILRLYNPASEYGRTQLQLIGRYENGNDGWTLSGGRNNIIFGYQTSLNSAVSYVNAIQSYAGQLGFFSSGYSTGNPAVYLQNGGRFVVQSGDAYFPNRACFGGDIIGGGVVNFYNTNGGWTHMGYPDGTNYIRGTNTRMDCTLFCAQDVTMNAGLLVNGTFGGLAYAVNCYYNNNSNGSWNYYGGTFGGSNYWSGYFSSRVCAMEFWLKSDERIKTNIQPIVNSLERLRQIKPVTYEYKDKHQNTGQSRHGLIAQQIEPILPCCVSTQHGNIYYIPDIYELCPVVKRLGDGPLPPASKSTMPPINPDKPDPQEERYPEGTVWEITLSTVPIFQAPIKLKTYLETGVHELIIDVIHINGNIITTITPIQQDRIFVYGTPITDFKTVNYQDISILTLKAMQELDQIVHQQLQKKVEQQQLVIEQQQKQIDEQKAQIASYEQRFKEHDAILKSLDNRLLYLRA